MRGEDKRLYTVGGWGARENKEREQRISRAGLNSWFARALPVFGLGLRDVTPRSPDRLLPTHSQSSHKLIPLKLLIIHNTFNWFGLETQSASGGVTFRYPTLIVYRSLDTAPATGTDVLVLADKQQRQRSRSAASEWLFSAIKPQTPTKKKVK